MKKIKLEIKERKALCIILLVATFFAGSIWISETATVGVLVAFLEACFGFIAGYNYKLLDVIEKSMKVKKKKGQSK